MTGDREDVSCRGVPRQDVLWCLYGLEMCSRVDSYVDVTAV